ncbi:MAG: EF-hand domain-containing protein [Alphaproteobacteria bacterium]|nr:EF-hand domain-containing protein [Alphaproteobacteria bacterium SS10]
MTDNQTDQKPNKPYQRVIYIGAGAASGVAVTVLAAALLLPSVVEAGRGGDVFDRMGGPGKHLMKMFQEADTDDDRRLSVTEFKAATGERFGGADTNDDGEVNQDEALEFMIERLKERIDEAFQRVDQDGNGTVSEQEFSDRMLQRFGRMDRNDDGFLSREDRRWGRGDRDGRHHGRHQGSHGDHGNQDTEAGTAD